jgi:NADH:ubiquinone oxidoreductase subunit 6 (subunit J)
MNVMNRIKSSKLNIGQGPPSTFLFDLFIYISVMFLIREVYFSQLSFIANGLFWSLTTLVFATWRMHVRGISWKDLGLCKPKSYKAALFATIFILGFAILSIVIFQILKDQLPFEIVPDNSNESAVSKFGDLYGNWILFFSILPFIWLESMLEEILDRGFLINWIERVLSSTLFATIIAVVVQALIFGFRHSNDFSERSITVGLIGLAMGIGYVLFRRNLWPLIIAHCTLNTMSMMDRVI